MRLLFLREMLADSAERFRRDAEVRSKHPLRHLKRNVWVRFHEVQIALLDRAIRALPQGSAPRPSKVEKYVVEHRDIKEPLLR
jgi:hypothetical protein